jgi:hypothetical protein
MVISISTEIEPRAAEVAIVGVLVADTGVSPVEAKGSDTALEPPLATAVADGVKTKGWGADIRITHL